MAIGKTEAPISPLDGEPGSLPLQKMPKIHQNVEHLLLELAQGFFDLDKHIPGLEMLQIIDDIRVCAQLSQQMGTQTIVDSSDQHRLFLRLQAIFCRLLSLPRSSEIQECCRIALIVWLFEINCILWCAALVQKILACIESGGFTYRNCWTMVPFSAHVLDDWSWCDDS